MEMNLMSTIEKETKNSCITLRNDGILTITFNNSTHITYNDAHELTDTIHGLFIDKKFLVLMDVSNISSFTADAQKMICSHKVESCIKGLVLLTSYPVSNLICDFYMELDKPAFPAKLYLQKDKAEKWLKLFSKMH